MQLNALCKSFPSFIYHCWLASILVLLPTSLFGQNPRICEGAFSAPWEYVGYDEDLQPEGTMGRANRVFIDTLHDKSFNTVYIGTDFSGLWKTENFQAEKPLWTCVTCDSRLPGIGAVDLAIHPQNPDTLLLATGIGPSFLLEYGLGVIRSTDGGKTWETSNISYDERGNMISASRVAYLPQNPQVVVALSRNNIYRSTNGGKDFKRVFFIEKHNKTYRSPFLNDLVFDPGNPSRIFVSSENGEATALRDGGGRLLTSADGGKTWNDITCQLPNACSADSTTDYVRVDLAVNPHIPGALRVLAISANGKKTLFSGREQNNGQWTWEGQTVSSLRASWWMADLEWSLTDSQKLYVAHVRPSEINTRPDAQGPYRARTIRYPLHIDIRDWDGIFFNGKYHLLAAHDGGVGLGSLDNGQWTWVNKNGEGLHITQFFGMAVSKHFAFCGGGTQDLGLIYTLNGKWRRMHIGDGYRAEFYEPDELLFVGNNSSIFTFNIVGNALERNGVAFNIGRDNALDIAQNGTAFYAPFATGNRGDQSARDKFDEDDDGNTGEYLKGNFLFYNQMRPPSQQHYVANRPQKLDDGGHRMSAVRVAPSDTGIVYIGTNKRGTNKVNRLYRIENPTTPEAYWIDLSASLKLPEGRAPKDRGQGITDIAVHPTKPNSIWVSYTHNTSSGKMRVMYHPDVTNGLLEWVHLADGLPQFPVNCLEFDRYNKVLYAGTDVGVWVNQHPEDPYSTWECFNNGLPVVKITDLEMDYCAREVYVSSFGRGIWRCPLLPDQAQYRPYRLTKDSVISSTTFMYKPLVIAGGAELEVQATLLMANGCDITVLPGGTLRISQPVESMCGKAPVPLKKQKPHFWQKLIGRKPEIRYEQVPD